MFETNPYTSFVFFIFQKPSVLIKVLYLNFFKVYTYLLK